jgi:hypothetical protein
LNQFNLKVDKAKPEEIVVVSKQKTKRRSDSKGILGTFA